MKKHFSLNYSAVVGEWLVFSFPKTNHYQIITNPKIFPKPHKTQTDQWGNEIKIFRLNDVKKNLIVMSFTYQAKPANFSEELMKKFSLSDYSRKNSSRYLQPNRFINGEDKKIKTLVRKIIDKKTNLYQITKGLYDFSLKFLSYANPIEGLYPYQQALEKKMIDCGGFSTFYLSLLQALGIPGRLVVGYLIKSNPVKDLLQLVKLSPFTFKNLYIHAWVEILLPNGVWFPADPSIEWKRNKGLSKERGGFGFIPANRLVTSFGCNFRLKMNSKIYNIDIYQNPKFL
jgi:transglutaminase-like putative cysteine protease